MTDSMRGSMSLDGDVEKLARFYRDWAAAYDDDVASHGYGLPDMMVETLRAGVARLPANSPAAADGARVLDAGCGTGLVGIALASAGWAVLDGIDLSHEMVAEARKLGIYRTLRGGVDLTDPPADLLGAAPIVTLGGVFTVGHVPPRALADVAGLVMPGGLLVVSLRMAYRAETDLDVVRADLEARGVLVPLVEFTQRPYTMDSTGDYLAWQVLAER